MNKLFTKIATLALGATMAVGVGVAVASNAKEPTKVEAASSTYVKVSSLSAGKEVLIVSHCTSGTYDGQYYIVDATTAATSSGPKVIAVSLTNSQIVGDYDSHLFTVAASSTSWTFQTGTKYLRLGAPSNNNGARIDTTNQYRAWAYSNGVLSNPGSGTTRYFGTYNNTDWRTYNSSTATNYYGSGENVEFYEKFTPTTTYTVSFNSNGGSGSMSDVTDVYGSYSLPACTFTAPSGKAFAGWKANNTGDIIAVAGSYTVSADVTFYAQWADQRTLTYNSNGGTGTMTDANSPYGDGATVTVLANTFTAPEGKRFSHWNTAADDTGTNYAAGATFSIGANTVLYAIWEDKPTEVVINHSDVANSGTSYATRTWTSDAITGTTLSAINSGGYFQFQKTSGANACFIANTDAIPGPITKVEITKKGSSATTAFDAYFGTSQISSKPASGAVSQTASNNVWTWNVDEEDEYTYFYIANGADDTKYFDDVTITYKKVSLVDPTEITLDDSTAITMDTYGYGKRKLIATVEPYNANDKTVTWGTNNPAVVTILDGVLTPVGTGSTTVYACTANYDAEDPNPDLIKSVSVTVTQAEYKKATFTPTSGSAATQSDDYLSGGSVTVSGTWNSTVHAIQLSSNSNSATFTISGYEGMQVIGVDLVMSSNGGSGTGSLVVTAGSTDILEIATAPFSDETWNGAYDANPVNLYKDCTDYVVEENEDIVFSFGGTVNSLYVYSVSIRYLDYSLESWCEDFLSELTGGEDPICKGYGITDTTKLEEAWTDLGARYLVEVSDDVKYIIEGATADESGTAIERVAALYDWCVTHYSASICDRFIDRASNGSGLVTNNNTILPAVNSETSIAIIVVISIVSVSAIGGYFFLRKRKETN